MAVGPTPNPLQRALEELPAKANPYRDKIESAQLRLDQAKRAAGIGAKTVMADVRRSVGEYAQAQAGQQGAPPTITPSRPTPIAGGVPGGNQGISSTLSAVLNAGASAMRQDGPVATETSTGPAGNPGYNTTTETSTQQTPINFGHYIPNMLAGAVNLFAPDFATRELKTTHTITRRDPKFDKQIESSAHELAYTIDSISDGRAGHEEFPKALQSLTATFGPREMPGLIREAKIKFEEKRHKDELDMQTGATLLVEKLGREGPVDPSMIAAMAEKVDADVNGDVDRRLRAGFAFNETYANNYDAQKRKADIENVKSTTAGNRANTASTLGGERRAQGLYPGQLSAQAAGIDQTRAQTEAIRGGEARAQGLYPGQLEEQQANILSTLTGTEAQRQLIDFRKPANRIALEQGLADLYKTNVSIEQQREDLDMFKKSKPNRLALLDAQRGMAQIEGKRAASEFNEWNAFKGFRLANQLDEAQARQLGIDYQSLRNEQTTLQNRGIEIDLSTLQAYKVANLQNLELRNEALVQEISIRDKMAPAQFSLLQEQLKSIGFDNDTAEKLFDMKIAGGMIDLERGLKGLTTEDLQQVRLKFEISEAQGEAEFRRRIISAQADTAEIGVGSSAVDFEQRKQNLHEAQRTFPLRVAIDEEKHEAFVFANDVAPERYEAEMAAQRTGIASSVARLEAINLDNEANNAKSKARNERGRRDGIISAVFGMNVDDMQDANQISKNWRASTKNGTVMSKQNLPDVQMSQMSAIARGLPIPMLNDSWGVFSRSDEGGEGRTVLPKEALQHIGNIVNKNVDVSFAQQRASAKWARENFGIVFTEPEENSSVWGIHIPPDNMNATPAMSMIELALYQEAMNDTSDPWSSPVTGTKGDRLGRGVADAKVEADIPGAVAAKKVGGSAMGKLATRAVLKAMQAAKSTFPILGGFGNPGFITGPAQDVGQMLGGAVGGAAEEVQQQRR